LSTEPTRRQAIVLGLVAIAAGAASALAIYMRPQALRAPAWVAYAAVGTFVLAGAALIAGALGARWLARWLGVLITCMLLVPSLWVAWGPGGRDCSFSLGFISGAASELFCRAGFGLGSILCLVFLGLLARSAFKANPEREGPSAGESRD
jgi:hypothetical protein